MILYYLRLDILEEVTTTPAKTFAGVFLFDVSISFVFIFCSVNASVNRRPMFCVTDKNRLFDPIFGSDSFFLFGKVAGDNDNASVFRLSL